MSGIVKVCVAGALGLAVLLASTGVSLAAPKFIQGKTYCQCSCSNSTGTADLRWEKVATCSINGRNCSFNNPSNLGKLEAGKLSSCMSCQANAAGGLLCSATAPGAMRDPREGLFQEQQKTIMPRGIEEGPEISMPVEQEEKAVTPK